MTCAPEKPSQDGAVKMATESIQMSESQQAMLAEGKKLYQLNCAICHGTKAEGQSASMPMGGKGPSGQYFAPALNGSAHTWHHSPEVLYKYLLEGSPDKKSPMISFADRLSHEEMKNLMVYIYSLWPEDIQQRYGYQFGDDALLRYQIPGSESTESQ